MSEYPRDLTSQRVVNDGTNGKVKLMSKSRIRSTFSTLAVCVVFLIVGLPTSTVGAAKTMASDLQAASRQGMVDINSSTNSASEIRQAIADLALIKPGIVNRLTYNWGGPNAKFIAQLRGYVSQLHQVSPDTLIIGTLPEVVAPTYALDVPGPNGQPMTLKASDVSSGVVVSKGFVWVDPARPSAIAYYEGLGRIFIDMGVTIISFEAVSGVLEHSMNAQAAIEGYQSVAKSLQQYADSKDKTVYFAGNATLAKYIKVRLFVSPSRFYHDRIPTLVKYENRVSRPGIGVGYSYVLSEKMIADTKANFPSDVQLFFGIDNWDGKQDDLHRFMELDAANRHFLMVESAKAAVAGGVHFTLPLIHCLGCTPPNVPVESCERLSSGMSQYDADRCGDIPYIIKALQDQRDPGSQHQG